MYSTDNDLKSNSFKHTSEVQFPFKKNIYMSPNLFQQTQYYLSAAVLLKKELQILH